MKFLLVLLTSINLCFALDVTPVKKGDPSPSDGFFVTTESMKKLRKINEEKKILEKENITLKDLSVINEKRIQTYKMYAEESHKQASWERTKGNFKGAGGFVLGVLATSLAAYAAIRVSK